jgi:murein DD-endopeptidase MepM/ murein hydrolase activator NlpD
MMFRYLILAINLFFYVNLHAQPKLSDNIVVNLPVQFTPVKIDSLVSIAEELPFDSLIPNDAIYYKDSWSSSQIRYSQNMLPSKEDTVAITFVGLRDSPFVPPVKGKVISKYGRRSGHMHTGTDIKLNSGDTVRCAFDGRVRLAKRFSGYGNLVLVRHKNGLETIYGHLKTICVQVNDTVKAGDLIGLGGRTGRATTDHLHFETRFLGEPFDSNKYIDFETFALSSDKIYYKNRQFETDPANFKGKAGRSQSISLACVDGVPQHIICKGDNLWAIARKYRTTVNKLCLANNITRDQVLKIGSVLLIN